MIFLIATRQKIPTGSFTSCLNSKNPFKINELINAKTGTPFAK